MALVANSLLADNQGSILLFEDNQDSLFSVNGNKTLVVDQGSYTISPQTDELLDGGSGEPLASGSESLISQFPGFPIAVKRVINVKPGKYEIFGDVQGLNVGGGFNLAINVADDELFIGKTSANKIYVNRTAIVTPATYGISPSNLSIRKVMNVSRAEYWTDKPSTYLAINPGGDTLRINAVDDLIVDQYRTFNPKVYKYVNVTPATYSIQAKPIFIYQEGFLFFDKVIFEITPFPITIDKVLNLPAQTGQYKLESFGVTFKPRLIPEGKYIRDSGNFYILYVDEGTDYYIKVNTEELGMEDNTEIQLTAEFARTSESVTKYEIRVTKIDSKTIRLDIDRDTTVGLYGRFKFNVMATRTTGAVSKFIRGDVIINNTISS